MLHLTAPAIAALRGVLTSKDAGLRLSASAGGCKGIQYGMSVACETCPDDTVCDIEGVRVIVDSASLALLSGTCIDFVESERGPGFVFDNPNLAGRCSCSKAG